MTKTIHRKDLIVLAILIIASFSIHSYFILDGFGEADAARLAISSSIWHHTGSLSGIHYVKHTSPLYLFILKQFISCGYSTCELSEIMNWSNVIFSSLVFIPLYFSRNK